jgi:hypothetical protein
MTEGFDRLGHELACAERRLDEAARGSDRDGGEDPSLLLRRWIPVLSVVGR